MYAQEAIVDDDRLAQHSWETVRSAILALHNRRHATVFLSGSNGQMMMEFVEDMGYYISAFGDGEIEEWLAVDKQPGDDWIAVDIAGHVQDVPRNILVSEAIALDVAEEFYRSGCRTQRHSWVTSLELMSKDAQRRSI